jgi:2-octaprenylphenol hydroxylase
VAAKQNKEFDIVVVGGGMVGCTTAALFARQGLEVCLINSAMLAQWNAHEPHPRVSAINIASMNLFQNLGIWQTLVERGVSPYRDMVVWENGSEASISFSASEMGLPALGYIVQNNVIVGTLADKLRQNYNVSVMENTTLEDCRQEGEGLILSTNNSPVQCKLLVGADGAHSSVRQISGIDTTFHDFRQDAIVTTVVLEKDHLQTAWQSFLPTGPVAMLPLSDGRCSIVWSCDRDYADEVMNMDDDNFCGALTGCFQQHLGRVLECEKRIRFPLKQHHVTRYINRSTALVGDAAHITHPLAGLGANIGFLDAAALVEVVATANLKGRHLAGQPTLRRYERWRKGENTLVLEVMKGFKNTFGSTITPVKSARRLGLTIANEVTPLKHILARYAMGISGDIPDICRPSSGR